MLEGLERVENSGFRVFWNEQEIAHVYVPRGRTALKALAVSQRGENSKKIHELLTFDYTDAKSCTSTGI